MRLRAHEDRGRNGDDPWAEVYGPVQGKLYFDVQVDAGLGAPSLSLAHMPLGPRPTWNLSRPV
jgi:hypothetical protein